MPFSLVRAGLRFLDENDERHFVEGFVISQRVFVQAAMLLGSVLYYIFFIWDRIVDPVGWETTHLIRGGVTLFLWACAALLFVPRMHRHMEALSIIAAISAAGVLPVIYSILKSGFDYGAAGVVLVLLFAFSLLPVRTVYYVILCAVTWLSFNILEVSSANSRSGMIIVNNMLLGTAILLGLLSAVMREYRARREFVLAKQLVASQERVEELLHSMLPREIVARIQAGETAIADAYGEVSIVFADLVGFTELARRVSPTHLVEVLNDLFSRFDLEAERHGIEKIKTIGDAYMAVGGMSARGSGSDHAEHAARFALAIQNAVADLSSKMQYPILIRVGMHVGPVVAGVIGTKRPAFDCWGEAVNLASRLEHSALPGGILISESAYWRLRHKFPTKVLDDIDLKGIGPAKVFMLMSPQCEVPVSLAETQ